MSKVSTFTVCLILGHSVTTENNCDTHFDADFKLDITITNSLPETYFKINANYGRKKFLKSWPHLSTAYEPSHFLHPSPGH